MIAPTDVSPTCTNVVFLSWFVGFIVIAAHISATNIRELWRTRLTTHRSERVHGMPKGHVPMWPWGHSGRKCRPGALSLLGSKGWVSSVLRVHSLLVNFKFRAGMRVWVGRSGVTQVMRFLGYSGLPERRLSWLGQPSFLSRCFDGICVMHLAICLFEMNVFKMIALATKSIRSGTYTTVTSFKFYFIHLFNIYFEH